MGKVSSGRPDSKELRELRGLYDSLLTCSDRLEFAEEQVRLARRQMSETVFALGERYRVVEARTVARRVRARAEVAAQLDAVVEESGDVGG